MKKIIRVYNQIMSSIGMIGLVGFIIAVLVQVVSRTFLPKAPNWTEEAARYLFIFMVAFAGNAAVANDEYVGVDLLTNLFPGKVQSFIRIMVLVMLWIFSTFVFYFCIIGPEGLLAMTPSSMVTTAMVIPMKYIYVSLAVLYGFYCLSFLFRIYTIYMEKGEK